MDAATPAASAEYRAPSESTPGAARPAFLREKREPGTPGHWAISGFLAANFGALPKASVGGGVLLSLKPRGFWGISIVAGGQGAQRKALDVGSLAVSMSRVGVGLCPLQRIADGQAWWSVCGDFQLAWFTAWSEGLLEPIDRTDLVVLPGLSARIAGVYATHWLLGGGAELSFPISPVGYERRDASGARQTIFKGGHVTFTTNLIFGVIIP